MTSDIIARCDLLCNPPRFAQKGFLVNEHNEKRFDNFSIISAVYSVVKELEIKANILIPELCDGSIIINYHGGGLFTGGALFKPWMPEFITLLAQRERSLLILPENLLMPNSNGEEILSGIGAFVEWIPKHLQDVLNQNGFSSIRADLDRVLICGQSAGAILAWHHVTEGGGEAKAINLQYPLTDAYSRDCGEYMGVKIDLDEAERLNSEMFPVMKAVQDAGKPVCSRAPPSYMLSSYVTSVTGSWIQLWDTETTVQRIKRAKTCPKVNCISVYHGEQDPNVPVDKTREFVHIVEQKFPGIPLYFTEVPDKQHAFDYDGEFLGAWHRRHLDVLKAYWKGSNVISIIIVILAVNVCFELWPGY